MDSRPYAYLVAAFIIEAFLLLLSRPALAAEPPPKEVLEELRFLKEETVSIAVRHEQPISEAPSNVYVITDEDIRQSGATDIPTILRRIPGIEVMQMTGAEFNVSARGKNQEGAKRLLVLVDGRSIYLDLTGNNAVIWKAIPVTLPEIKRIEVLKGPASALYGFNAFDGVISIITKSPEEMKGTTLQFGGGEFGTLSASGIEGGTYGKLGYRLSVGRDQNNQWRGRDALAFRDHKFNIHTEYAISALSKLVLEGGHVDVNRFDGPIQSFLTISSQPTHDYAFASYERRNVFIRSWWNGFSDAPDNISNPLLARFLTVVNRDGSSKSSFVTNTYNVEGQHIVEWTSNNQLTYGINYRHNTLSSSATDTFSQEDRLGFYIQEEWRPFKAVSVVGGVRYDLHSEIHNTLSPRLAILYSPILDHTFRVGLSVSYRPPTLFDTHTDFRQITTLPAPLPPVPAIVVRGSGNLQPEELVSYEVGYQGWFFRHRLRARLDLFLDHVSDLIGTTQTSTTSVTFANGPEADIYGGEASLEFLVTRWLSGFANYSYEEIGQRFRGALQRGAPRFKWNVGLRGEWENGLSGEVALHHVGAATYPISSAFVVFAPFGVVPPNPRVGSYNLLNLRAGYRFWHEKAEVAVSAFNALNDRHKEHPLGDTIGSRVMGWLTIRW